MSMAFCSCCARAVSGRRCPGSLARGRPCIGAFSGGRMRGGGKRCGACSCNMPRRRSSSSGCDSRPTRSLHKAPLGGKKTGANPTDRAKSGTKRHVLTDGGGVPLAVVITPANVPDMRVVGELLDARVLRAPTGTEQHACLDKGYDYADAERAVRRRRYVPHIRRRGEERRACRHGARPRRWVVERATSWFNRCRKLLIRWEKKPQNYLALVHFAAAIVVWRALVG